MSLPEAVTELAARWDEVAAPLDAAQRADLSRLAGALITATTDARRRTASMALMDLVTPVLPAEHPVRRALATDRDRLKISAGWAPATASLAARMASTGELSLSIPLASNSPSQVREAAAAWVLAEPAVSPDQVRGWGTDPDSAALIRLSHPRGEVQLPAFQFAADGLPHPVVITINLMLGAAEDPWGVADWWLGRNAWLGVAPVEVIGHAEDKILIDAARAAVAED
jgi:hypothetical protein